MMMPNLKKLLPALCAIALLNVSILGCAQKSLAQKQDTQPEGAQTEMAQPENLQSRSAQPGNAQSEVCRLCHTAGKAAGARDFASIYAKPASHHPVGVSYPLGPDAFPKFNPPNGQNSEVAFFDANGNGRPDTDEVQLFGTSIAVTVECASCHREHGDSPGSEYVASHETYLRVINFNSTLCITCHRQ
jgi:cytochrome c553